MGVVARGRGALVLMTAAALLGACAGGGSRVGTGPGAAGQSAGDLEELLAFDNPAECEPGKSLKTLYDTLAAYDAAFQPQPRRPELPPHLARAAGEPVVLSRDADHAVISLPLRGRWKGLPVRAVEGMYGIESDAFGLAIVFDAPVDRTQAVLRDSGFINDKTVASVGAVKDSAFGRAAVTGDERTSRLVCDWGL